jgi:hypothetical protein
MAQARKDLLRAGRQSIAIERAISNTMRQFQIDWLRHPEDISAVIQLALESLADHPDFAELREVA